MRCCIHRFLFGTTIANNARFSENSRLYRMKIHHRLLATFTIIALLAGVVALYSLNATRQIIKSFEGGEEHFQKIIAAANEVGSQTKRAQSHLMLFLGLEDKQDREEFFRRYRVVLQQVALLQEMVQEPEGREIVTEIRTGVDKLYESAQQVLSLFDIETLAGRKFDPAAHAQKIRNFFAVTSNIMRSATRLANLETDFLNKQYAILNASTINHLAKLTEGQLMLYMLLNDQRDLERYMVGINTLEATVQNVRERIRDEKVDYLLRQLEEEVRQFKEAGEVLFQAFHGEQQRLGQISLRDYSSKVLDFHERSSNIRELAVKLSNLMTEQEYQKKEEARRTAASIQRSLFFFVVVGGVLTLLLGYFLSVTIAEPIVKLQKAALRIGKGDLDAAEHLRGKGEIGKLIETFRDMARDLKETRNQLIASKEYVDNILRSMSDALCVVAPDGRLKTVNRAMCDLLGYEAGELVGRPFASIFASAPPFECEADNLEERAAVRPLVTTYQRKDGEPVAVSFSSSVMYGPGGELQGIVCVAQDMTSRRRAMQELRQLATVVEPAAEAIVVCSPDVILQYVHPACENITG